MRLCPKCRHPMQFIARVVRNITDSVLVCVRCNYKEKR